jgi:hypothetical protein
VNPDAEVLVEPEWLPEELDDLVVLAEEIDDVLQRAGTELDLGPCFVRMLLAQLDVVEAAISTKNSTPSQA